MRLVISTVPVKEANRLATHLIEEKLAACVNIIPSATSIYIWKGKLEQDEEAILFIKTTTACVDRLSARLKALHPYDVPEIISLQIKDTEGNPAYLSWIKDTVAS